MKSLANGRRSTNVSSEADLRVRLGDGDVTTAEAQLWDARRWFLRAVDHVSPDTYRSLFPTEPGDDAFRAYREKWNDDSQALIAKWQRKWNLTDPWCAEVARNTLWARLSYYINGLTAVWGVGRRADRYVTPPSRVRDEQVLGLHPVEPFWDRGKETWPQVEARFLAAIRAQRDRIEAAATEEMLAPTHKELAHFVWLANYQVCRHRYSAIAEDSCRDPQTIRDAVKGTARLIGLTRRAPDPPGRPPRN